MAIDLEKFDKLLELLRLGHTRKDAARLSGIHWETVKGWVKGAKEGNGYDEKMVQHLECSEANIVDDALRAVTKAAKDGQWKAAAFLLESKRPDDFGRREKPAAAPTALNISPALTSEQSKEKLFNMAMKLCLEDPKYKAKLIEQVRLLNA